MFATVMKILVPWKKIPHRFSGVATYNGKTSFGPL